MSFNKVYKICVKKLQLHMEKNSGLINPPETKNGDYYESVKECDFVGNRWIWLNSMITGMAPIISQTEKDFSYIAWANSFSEKYHEKVFKPYTQTMHDIGFLYLPYSVHLYRLTGDISHRDTALKAADELAKRFNVRGRFIEAWDDMNNENRECRMIVDSSMNVSLLYWAWKETGHYFYRDVADCHLETIIKTLFREDHSVAHAWFFDPETGAPTEEANSCGYENGSHWARGTAWLVYGLAAAYSYTKNERFLDVAVKAGEKYLDSLDDNPVPVWDFRLPKDTPAQCGDWKTFAPHWDITKSENKTYNVDSSAAAIMTCAFQLICSFVKNERFEKYIDEALTVLTEEYLDGNLNIPAMLKRVDGKDIYAIYADYYYLQALCVKLFGIKTCWENDKADVEN